MSSLHESRSHHLQTLSHAVHPSVAPKRALVYWYTEYGRLIVARTDGTEFIKLQTCEKIVRSYHLLPIVLEMILLWRKGLPFLVFRAHEKGTRVLTALSLNFVLCYPGNLLNFINFCLYSPFRYWQELLVPLPKEDSVSWTYLTVFFVLHQCVGYRKLDHKNFVCLLGLVSDIQ